MIRWLPSTKRVAGVLALRLFAFGQSVPAPDRLSSAQTLLNMGLFEDAEKVVRQFLQTSPESAEGHFLLGKILFREKKPVESLAEFTAGAKYRAPSAIEFEVIGMDYVLLNSLSDADKWFTRAVDADPGNALGWYYLGRTKYNENRFEEAVQAFEKCLALDQRDVKAEDNMGLSYEGLGDYEKAADAYGKAIAWQASHTPKNAEPYFNLGGLHLSQNRPAEALPYLEHAVQFSPEEAKMHQRLGKCYLALNHLDQAQSELETAVRMNSQDAALHYLLQQVYRKKGLADKANDELARYRQLQAAPPLVKP